MSELADMATGASAPATPAHSRCAALIFTYDPQSFDPLSPPGSPGVPDGRWGRWSRDDGAGRRVRSRRADARFWEVRAVDYAGQDQFPGLIELPADNTGRDAASTNVPLEALADRTVWLKNQTVISQHAHSAYNPLVLATFSGTNFAQSSIERIVNGARAGEMLSIDLSVNLQYVGTTGNWGNIRVAVIERWGTPNPATYTPQGTIMIMGQTGTATYAAGASLVTLHPVQSDGNIRVVVEGRTEPTAGMVLRVVGSYGLRVLKHRG